MHFIPSTLLAFCGFFLTQVTVLGQIDEPTWKPVIKKMKKAEKYVSRFVSQDTLLENDTYSLFLRWEKDPNKPYLILIHGMGLNGSTMWKSQVESLSESYNLIIPDLIGYGKSEMKKADYTPEFQVKSIFNGLSAIGVHEKVHVLGFSYGGLVAALSQKMYPNRVDKLIVCDAPVKYFTAQLADSMAKNAGLDSIQQIIVPQTVLEARKMLQVMTAKKVNAPDPIMEKVRKNVFALNSTVKYGQMTHLQQNAYHYNTLNYQLIGSKTTFLWGSEDGVIPPVVGQKLHVLYPESSFYLFEGGKHDIHVFDSKRFNELVLKELME